MDKRELYAGWVWLISAISLIVYGLVILANERLTGLDVVVNFLTELDGVYIYGGAFLSILIEGLYVVGNFFPGATLVVLLAIVSQFGGSGSFLLTIFIICVGWCLAGAVNIALAHFYGTRILQREHDPAYEVKDKPWATFYPAFRANYEVAQIAHGGKPLAVLWSSIRVKAVVSLVMLGVTALVPFFIDVNDISKEEGVASILVIAAISAVVGIHKIRRYSQQKTTA